MDRQFGGIRTRNEVGRAEIVKELLARQPAAPLDDLVLHHRDVRRRSAERRDTQAKEQPSRVLTAESVPSPDPSRSPYRRASSRAASADNRPGPAAIRKISEHSIAKSVRASLTMNQNPCEARDSSGILVVTMAVVITIRSGISRKPGPQAEEHEHPARDFERADEVRGERGEREPDPCEAFHAHVRVEVLEQALGGEDHANCQANPDDAAAREWNGIQPTHLEEPKHLSYRCSVAVGAFVERLGALDSSLHEHARMSSPPRRGASGDLESARKAQTASSGA